MWRIQLPPLTLRGQDVVERNRERWDNARPPLGRVVARAVVRDTTFAAGSVRDASVQPSDRALLVLELPWPNVESVRRIDGE
jgi:hypothetical protein